MGLVNPPDTSDYEAICAGDPRRKSYRKLVFRKNILTGAVLINAIEQGGIFMGLIQNEIPLNIANSVLLEPSFNFKQLMM